MGDNTMKIGGVSFNKNDVKSSEQIQKDGKTLNSVFLKDGTQVVFPNQSEGNQAEITQRYGQKQVFDYHFGYQASSGEVKYHYGPRMVEDKDKVITDANNLYGLEITGTEKADTYYLEGCVNSKVDVSQDDGKKDTVHISDRETGLFKKTTYKSSGNVVELGKDDVARIEVPEKEQKGPFSKKHEQHTGPKTAKERN